MISLGLSVLITCYFTAVQGQEKPPGIWVSGSNRMKPNTETYLNCKIAPQWTGSSVEWWRRTGEIEEKIGENSVLIATFANTRRYVPSQSGDGSATYVMNIKELRYEDSAEIGCSARGSGLSPYYASLAVCDDTETFECKCVADTGWISPNCFEKHPSIDALQARYNRATTGLGICLAIAIVFGFIMAILAGVDCMGRLAAKRKRKQELAKMRQRHDPGMYEGDEVKLDPNDTASNIDFGGKTPTPRIEEKKHNYSKLNGEVSHSNPAFLHEDDGYQEIRETAQPSPYRRYPSGPAPQAAGAQPIPEEYPQRSPGGPRPSPREGAYGGYENNTRSPGTWSAHSAAPTNFRYPDQERAPAYDSLESPRNLQPNPRNAYSERPPAQAPGYKNAHMDPKRLYFTDENQSSPYNNLSHSNYEEYAPNHSGSYIDKTDTVV